MYDLSGDTSRLRPKVLPFLPLASKKDLEVYLVEGGLQVKVFVKSDLLLSGILNFVLLSSLLSLR